MLRYALTLVTCFAILSRASADGMALVRVDNEPSGSSSPKLVVQDTPSNRIASMATSPDGRLVATGGDQGTVSVWHRGTKLLLRTLTASSTSVQSLAFSPDSIELAAGTLDGKVCIWNISTGQLITSREQSNQSAVNSLAFDMSAKQLVTACDNGVVAVWDAANARLVRVLSRGNGPATALTFSPDGRRLVSAESVRSEQLKVPTGLARIWTVSTWTEMTSLNLHTEHPIDSVAFSPSGEIFSVVTGDELRVYRSADSHQVTTLRNPAPVKRYDATCPLMALSPDGKRLAYATEISTWNRDWCCWNESGTGCRIVIREAASQMVLDTIDIDQDADSLIFSPRGNQLVMLVKGWSANDDFHVVTVETKPSLRISSRVRLVSSGNTQPRLDVREGSVVSTTSSTGDCLKVWDLGTGQLISENWAKLAISEGEYYADLTCGGDVVAWHSERSVHLVHAPSGRSLGEFPCDRLRVTLVISTDGKRLAMMGWDNISAVDAKTGLVTSFGRETDDISVWDIEQKKRICVIPGQELPSLAFVGNGSDWLVVSGGGGTTIYDMNSGSRAPTTPKSEGFRLRDSASACRYLLADDSSYGCRVLDLWTNRIFSGEATEIAWLHQVWFADSGRLVCSVCPEGVLVWEIDHGQLAGKLSADTPGACAVSGDFCWVADGDPDAPAPITEWSISRGKRLTNIEGRSELVKILQATDNNLLLERMSTNLIQISDLLRGTRFSLELPDQSWPYRQSAIDGNGQLLATTRSASELVLFELSSTQELFRASIPPSPGGASLAMCLGFDPTGSTVFCASDISINSWDIRSHQHLASVALPNQRFRDGVVRELAFSPDASQLAAAMLVQEPEANFRAEHGQLRIWNVADGRLLRDIRYDGGVHSVAYCPTGRSLALSYSLLPQHRTPRWQLADCVEVLSLPDYGVTHRIEGFSDGIGPVAFSSDGSKLFISTFAAVVVFSLVQNKELCRIYSFQDGTWAVIDSEGRYDGSDGGDVPYLHWVVGTEPITLSQLKERYYEPGLLAKILGIDKTPPRDVSPFRDVKLYPDVQVKPPAQGSSKFSVDLMDQGGGIGRLQVFVNGKEQKVIMPEQMEFDAGRKRASAVVDLAEIPVIASVANKIKVVAWNAEDYLSSRGSEFSWVAPGTEDKSEPELYAIIGGISRYSSSALNLDYADDDARDMAKALEIGAKRLFGTDKAHISLICTSDDLAVPSPTKANFDRAFKDVQAKAKPQDVLVIYLAGHGVACSDRENNDRDDYCYLTSEAISKNVSDPVVREQRAITGNELVTWTRDIRSLKQVLILDTCSAGVLAEQWIEKRDVASDQIRALERLKDRTGFHVLMSCSGESSYGDARYGHGLLTYTLLKGMKGAALREDRFVDVSTLFQYATDRVPFLAKKISRSQQPRIAAPDAASFDIGVLTKEDKEAVPLGVGRPIVIRPMILNSGLPGDTLSLTAKLREALQNENHPRLRDSAQLALAYEDTDEFPGAIRPVGTYAVNGDKISLTLVLWQDGQTVAQMDLQASTNDLQGLLDAIIQSIRTKAAEVWTSSPASGE